MLRIVVMLCLVSFALGFTVRGRGTDGRIVGGTDTDIRKYPYQASILMDGSHLCGGSIISADWILSAAHCFLYEATTQIRVGSSIRDSGGVVFEVAQVISHENFDSNVLNNDIALLRLSSPITFSATAQPVTLPSAGEEVAVGTSAVVTGWGLLEEQGSLATVLQEVDVPVISNEDCRTPYPNMITPQMLCAGYQDGGRDSCTSDSGGPLVANGKQIGVVSFGNGCARPGYPGVYANVATLRDWISVKSGI